MIAQGGFERMHESFESKFLCFGRVASVVLVRRCDSSEVGMEMINLPGWRWATIKQVALDRLSRSLHSDVCDSDGCNDVVVHSTISGRGGRRERATLNVSSSKCHSLINENEKPFMLRNSLVIDSLPPRSLDVSISS